MFKSLAEAQALLLETSVGIGLLLHVVSLLGQDLKGLRAGAVWHSLPLCTLVHKRTQRAQPVSATLSSAVSPAPTFRCFSTCQMLDVRLGPSGPGNTHQTLSEAPLTWCMDFLGLL